MEKYYTSNKSVQILISLLKAHNIRKVIASPGNTNMEFIGSIENDPFFEIYSSVDERSAAYIACGLASSSGEAVVLSCTGATASRNYFPGLTEAYYRQLPVLALTSTQFEGKVGSYAEQVIDRSVQPLDSVKISVKVQPIYTHDEEWFVNTQINKALLELFHKGCGPVHINLTTTYSRDYSVKELPVTRVINRLGYEDEFPNIEKSRNVAVFVGAHLPWSDRLKSSVEEFCKKYNAVVLHDHTSNYQGAFGVNTQLAFSQESYSSTLARNLDLVIHIGNVSGSEMWYHANEVWRVNPDGEIRDTFHSMTKIFEMTEEFFFEKMNLQLNTETENLYFKEWQNEMDKFELNSLDLPFSNAWLASVALPKLPSNCTLYLGILNSLRTWQFYSKNSEIECYSNTGGFGIDGIISSAVGASINNRSKLVFCVLGDLAFFYDMNVIGNHIIGNNLRILLVNNGMGCEFTNYMHFGHDFGEDAKKFIAAAGHFGNKSTSLVKHYAEDLGYKYLSAHNKEEFISSLAEFVKPSLTEEPIIFEVFTDNEDESNAIKSIKNMVKDAKGTTKKVVKSLIGQKGVSTLKAILKK